MQKLKYNEEGTVGMESKKTVRSEKAILGNVLCRETKLSEAGEKKEELHMHQTNN